HVLTILFQNRHLLLPDAFGRTQLLLALLDELLERPPLFAPQFRRLALKLPALVVQFRLLPLLFMVPNLLSTAQRRPLPTNFTAPLAQLVLAHTNLLPSLCQLRSRVCRFLDAGFLFSTTPQLNLFRQCLNVPFQLFLPLLKRQFPFAQPQPTRPQIRFE